MKPALLPRVLAIFPTVHVAHGLGMLPGWIRAAFSPRTRSHGGSPR